MPANVYYDRMTTISKLQDFSAHWAQQVQERKTQNHTNVEKQHAQQLWSDFLRCLGIIPERIALFEQRADRVSTGQGGLEILFDNSQKLTQGAYNDAR